jgi:hypothetical protein
MAKVDVTARSNYLFKPKKKKRDFVNKWQDHEKLKVKI